jgi:hypothetical protein
MAQVTITQLPAAGALTGNESVPIVQNGQTVQTTTSAISGAGALNFPFLTVGSTVGLTQARQIAAGSGLSLTDGGAGSTLQVNMTGAALSLNSSGTGLQVKTGANTVTARQITVGGGMTISNGDGVSGNPLIGLNTNLQNLSALSGIGLMTINGTTFSQTTLLGTTNQVTIANGDASGGNPTIALASNPVLPGTGGVLVPVGTSGQRIDTNGVFRYNTTTARFEGYQGGAWISMGIGDGTVTSVSGTAGQIGVTSPTSTPVISIVPNAVLPGTGSVVLPQGTTAQRSASGFGALRYNTDTASLEVYTQGTGWGAIISGSGVSTFSGGATGLTPNTPTTGGIVLGGILGPTYGGTGVNNGSYTVTLGGNVVTAGSFTTSGAFSLTLTTTGNTSLTLPTTGTLATLAGSETLTNKTINGANNTLSNIGNSSLTNSSVTYNGVTVALGASGTITAATTNALTVGTGLQLNSGTTFDGSAAKTISIDSTVATLTGSQTLTNKTINGPDNTLTNIANSSLSNSSLTYNGVSVSLGGSGTITANTTNALTFNNSGTGDASGTTFNGSAAKTISYNSVGASPLAGSTSLTTLGTITTGVWNGTAIGNNYLANSSLTIGTTTISLGGTSLTLAGLTSVTLTQDPTSDLQAATKQYVDSVAQGLNVKASVLWGTTGNITLSGLGTQAGGEWTGTLTAGDRILVKNQTASADNGIYAAASSGWTRTADANTWNELISAFVFVQDGATLADTGWVCTVNPGGTLGVTAVTWSQFSGAGTYTAGTGLTLTGTQFSLTSPVVASLGGTGYTSYTAGDLLYATGATALSKLAIGASTYILTSSGSAPQWSVPSGITVGTATDAVNTGVTASSTNATHYLTFVSATTGNLPQLVNSSITCNPSTGQMTGGIAGGAF